MMTLTMGDNIKRNTSALTPWNITAQVRGYRRRMRDIGGFWTAEGTYWTGKDDGIVSAEEAERLFLTGIGNHVVETCGSQSVFEGMISKMTFTRNGQTSVRDLNDVVNSLKINYSRFTGNLLLNGSAELGTISEYSTTPGNYLPQTGTGVHSTRGDPYWDEGHGNTPYPILSISTAWSSHGTRSFLIDCEPMFGGIVLTTGMAVTGGGKYQVKGTIYYQTLASNPTSPITVRVRAGTSEEVSTVMYLYVTPATVSVYSFSAIFEAPDTATGDLMISVWGDDEAVFYVDGFSLQEIGSHKETAYASVADSISQYGLHDETIVCGALGDDEAITRRDNWLNRLAWARAVPEKYSGNDGLTIEVTGYVFMLGLQSVTLGGLLAASTHINNLIPLCSFLSVGYVATNSLLTYVAEDKPTRIWEAVQSVTESGGAGGVEYVCGVGPGRAFFYKPRETTCLYKWKVDNLGIGHWLNMDNTLAVAQLMRPGIIFFEDMMTGPGQPIGESIEDDPRYMRVFEWEYDADSDTATPTEYKYLGARNRVGNKPTGWDAQTLATEIQNVNLMGTEYAGGAVHNLVGSSHAVSGLDAGPPAQVLKALTPTTFGFGVIADADVPGTIARDSEVTTAISDHAAIPAAHHAVVTVSGTYDYITLSGQDIVRGQIDLAADVTGTLPIGKGGTGLATWTQYGVVYASAATTLAQLGLGTTVQVLHGNAAGAPTWSAVSLTADVTGTLPGSSVGLTATYIGYGGAGGTLAGSANATLDAGGNAYFAGTVNVGNAYISYNTGLLSINTVKVGGDGHATIEIFAGPSSPHKATLTVSNYGGQIACLDSDLDTAGMYQWWKAAGDGGGTTFTHLAQLDQAGTLRLLGGLYVGSLATDPGADNLVVDGGINVGTASGATAGEIRASAGLRLNGITSSGQSQMKQHSILIDGIAQVANSAEAYGLLFVSGYGTAIYALHGAGHSVTEIADSLGTFTVTEGNVGTINIYWDAGNSRYEIENKTVYDLPGIIIWLMVLG